MRPLQIGRAPEFVGGKARRSRPKSRSRSKRSVRNSQKPQRSHFGDVGFRRIEWCTPHSRTCVRSQPSAGRSTQNLRIRCRATQMPLVEAISSPTPLLPNASTPTTLRADPGQTQGPKRGSGRAISPRAGPDLRGRVPFTRGTVSVSIQHTLPAGGLRRRRSASAALVAMKFFGPHTSRFQANRAVCANSSIARG